MRLALLLFLLCGCGPGLCLQVEEVPDLCETHPFGPAIGCGAERPQLRETCDAVVVANPGLCVEDYVGCREALRLAPCGTCPAECAGILLACGADDVEPTTG